MRGTLGNHMTKNFTLKDYADRILKPTVVAHVRNGSLDDVLGDPDCLEILFSDPETAKVTADRLRELEADQ